MPCRMAGNCTGASLRDPEVEEDFQRRSRAGSLQLLVTAEPFDAGCTRGLIGLETTTPGYSRVLLLKFCEWLRPPRVSSLHARVFTQPKIGYGNQRRRV